MSWMNDAEIIDLQSGDFRSGAKKVSLKKKRDVGMTASEDGEGILSSAAENIGEHLSETIKNPIDTLNDAMAGAEQGFTLGLSDELVGKAGEIYEYSVTGDPDKAKIYGDNLKQKMRGRYETARERSPYAYYGAEILTPSVGDVVGAGSASRLNILQKFIRSGMAQAPVAAYGYSDENEVGSDELALSSIVGGVAGDLPRKVVTQRIKNPRTIRQQFLGATKLSFAERGRLKREAVDKFLEEKGFYKGMGKKRLSIDDDLNIVKTNRKIPKDMRPEEVMLENAESIVGKASNKVDNALYTLSDSERGSAYTLDSFLKNNAIKSTLFDMVNSSKGGAEALKAYNSVVSHIKNSFATGELSNMGETLNLYQLNQLKRELQTLGKKSLTSSGEDTVKSDAFAKMSTAVKEMIENEANAIQSGAGDYIRHANEIQSNLLAQSNDLVKKVGYEKASTMSLPYLSMAGIMTAGAKDAVSTPWFAKKRVALGRFRENNPVLSDIIGADIKNLPIDIANIIVNSPGGDNGRSPDSIGQMNNIPKMLANTPIPRDSKLILKNKEFVKAKVAMSMPDALPSLEQALDDNPAALDDALPILIQMAPNLFERDTYNRINGKMYDPQDRIKALKDIYQDEEMSNTEKAMISNNIALKGMM